MNPVFTRVFRFNFGMRLYNKQTINIIGSGIQLNSRIFSQYYRSILNNMKINIGLCRK